MSMLFLLQLKTNHHFFQRTLSRQLLGSLVGFYFVCICWQGSLHFAFALCSFFFVLFCSFHQSSVLIRASIHVEYSPFISFNSDNTWAIIRASACPFALTLKFIIWGQCHMDHVCCRTAPLITLSQINKSCRSLRPASASLVHALHLRYVKSHFKPCDNEHMLWFHCKK